MKWITRQNANVDRIACPWLIKRFVDQDAEFLYVPANEVMAVAAIGPSGSGSLEITTGPCAGSSGMRPCEPFTSDASSGITSSSVRKPSFCCASFHV